jgi:hypothetical protein
MYDFKGDEDRAVQKAHEERMRRFKEKTGIDGERDHWLAAAVDTGMLLFSKGTEFHWHRDPGKEGGVVVMKLEKVTRQGFEFASYSKDGSNKRIMRFTMKVHGEHVSAMTKGTEGGRGELESYIERQEDGE